MVHGKKNAIPADYLGGCLPVFPLIRGVSSRLGGQ